MDAIYEEHRSLVTASFSIVVTTRWLQCDQTLPLCKGCGLQVYGHESLGKRLPSMLEKYKTGGSSGLGMRLDSGMRMRLDIGMGMRLGMRSSLRICYSYVLYCFGQGFSFLTISLFFSSRRSYPFSLIFWYACDTAAIYHYINEKATHS